MMTLLKFERSLTRSKTQTTTQIYTAKLMLVPALL